MENSFYDADDKICFPDKEETIIHNDVVENHSIEEIISSLNYKINELLGTRTIEVKRGELILALKSPSIGDV